MNQHLNSVYKGICCETVGLAAQEDSDFKKVYQKAQKAFESLFEAGSYQPEDLVTNKSYKALVKQTAKLLDSAILDNVKGKAMQEALSKDVFLFSRLRTHAQLDQASRLLTDKHGNIRSFQQFSYEFNKINKLYNQNYLSAEYNYAVTVTQTIDRWESFDDDEERYWLQFRTAMDDKVRDTHAELQGTTLPKSDPFWDEYVPPLDWNCRCQVVEVLASDYTLSDSKKAREEGEKATTRIGKNGKNKASIFRFNPAKEKVIFPENHPYRKVPGAKKVGRMEMEDLFRQKNPRYHDYGFMQISTNDDSGHLEEFTTGHQEKAEWEKNRNALKILVRSKQYQYRMLPVINDGQKNPDAYNLLTGQFSDIKVPEGTNGRNIVTGALKEASRQGATEVIIHLRKKPDSYRDLYFGFEAEVRFKRALNIETAIVIYPDNSIKEYKVKEMRVRFLKKSKGRPQ